MSELKPLKIITRYTEESAEIELGHSYTCPSKVTKRKLRELLKDYDDDEILNISQIENIEGIRPLIIRSVHQDDARWKCLCLVGVE